MRTEVTVGFRISPSEVKSTLPTPLRFLSRAVKEETLAVRFDLSYANSPIDPELLEPLIEWGREKLNGESRIRLLRVEEKYDLQDLEGLCAVEMYASDEMEDTLRVPNFAKVLEAKWDCRRCYRSRWCQSGQLEVRPKRGIDFQLTSTSDWILSSRAQELMGVGESSLRDLRGGQDWKQLVVTDRFRIDAERSYLKIGEPCPGCGRPQEVHRNDVVEGSYARTTGITVCRIRPITISVPSRTDWIVAASDLEFGSFTRLPSGKRHDVGDPIELEQRHVGGMYPRRILVVSMDVAKRLMDAHIRGVVFRPVIVV